MARRASSHPCRLSMSVPDSCNINGSRRHARSPCLHFPFKASLSGAAKPPDRPIYPHDSRAHWPPTSTSICTRSTERQRWYTPPPDVSQPPTSPAANTPQSSALCTLVPLLPCFFSHTPSPRPTSLLIPRPTQPRNPSFHLFPAAVYVHLVPRTPSSIALSKVPELRILYFVQMRV